MTSTTTTRAFNSRISLVKWSFILLTNHKLASAFLFPLPLVVPIATTISKSATNAFTTSCCISINAKTGLHGSWITSSRVNRIHTISHAHGSLLTQLKSMTKKEDDQQERSDKSSSSSSTSGAPSNGDNTCSNSSTTTTTTSESIEVEKKFRMSTSDMKHLQSTLTKMGFVPFSLSASSSSKIQFMDWYFDTSPPDNMTFCTQDCWLRYRSLAPKVPSSSSSSSGGHLDSQNLNEASSWELKIGKVFPTTTSTTTTNNKAPRSNSLTTVYQELTGLDAIQKAVSMLKKRQESGSDTHHVDTEEIIHQMDGYDIPNIPQSLQAYGIQPFARIQTTRFQWKMDSSLSLEKGWTNTEFWNTVKVDMDLTDFGYAVGEVEAIVHSIDQVNHAKEVIEHIVSQITSADRTARKNEYGEMVVDAEEAPVLGKLETYLMHNQPQVYSVCVGAGVMKDRDNKGMNVSEKD